MKNNNKNHLSITINSKTFQDFKKYCKEKDITMSFIIRDFIKKTLESEK